MTDSAPPVYNPVSTNENEEAPPSYFNIMSQIKNAKSEAKSPTDLIQKTGQIICGSFLISICLGISSILPIAMLVIGLMSQDKCPVQTKIPLWLIVSGAAGIANALLKFFSNIVSCAKYRKNNEVKEPAALRCLTSLLGIFLFIWFILGNIWVYQLYSKVTYDPLANPDTYCDKLCYLFSFWSITASWIIVGLSCACMVGLCVCVVVGVGCCAAASK